MRVTTLDPQAILAALGVRDVRAATPVHGGWDTAIWRVEALNRICALRVYRPEQAATSVREVAVLRAAASAGIPVPAVHGQTIAEGRPALLLSWCPGRTLAQALARRPLGVWRLGSAFGRMQAAIHRVSAPAALQEASHWTEWAGPEEAALQAVLARHTARDESLLHLDYHPLNVLADGHRITGVLDWANARAGDPRADVARTVAILRLVPPARPSVVETVGRRLLIWAWRRGYEQVAGPLGDLAPFYAWAGAVLVRDLGRKIGRPGIWLQPQHLTPMRQWTSDWKRRAGVV